MSKTHYSQGLPESKLYNLALAKVREDTLENAYNKTQLKIAWLQKFRDGKIENPSVRRIEMILTAYDVKLVRL